MMKEQKPGSVEFRTRAAQESEIYEATAKAVCRGRPDYPPEVFRAYLKRQIIEAEARGASEQRRKDADGAEPFAWGVTLDIEMGYPFLAHKTPISPIPARNVPLYVRPVIVAALEARVKELEAQLVESEKRSFNHGYLIACCNISHLHDEPSIARDVLAECGLGVGDISAIELSDYDAKALSEIRASRGDRDPIREGGVA